MTELRTVLARIYAECSRDRPPDQHPLAPQRKWVQQILMLSAIKAEGGRCAHWALRTDVGRDEIAAVMEMFELRLWSVTLDLIDTTVTVVRAALHALTDRHQISLSGANRSELREAAT